MDTPSADQPAGGQVIEFRSGRASSALVEEVYRLHEKRLVRYLKLRLGATGEAEDAAQQAFVRLWQKRETITDQNLVSLLFVTARNIATDMLRKKHQMRISVSTERDWNQAELVQDQQPSPERALAAKQDLAIILKIIDELPVKCRAAFVSYKFHNIGYPEIAQQLGVTESMVRKYIIKAICHCSRRFEELEGWE